MHRPIVLARYLALACFALIVYASLHPFSGWRDSGLSPFAFLEGGWPRYWTVFDLLTNIAAYLPFGFLLTLAISRLPGRYSGAIVATLLAAGSSGCLEAIQTWLPSRVPSNVDLACNALGGLLGAMIGQYVGPRFFARVSFWQHRLLAPQPHAELGLTLIGLWLLIPLSPEILLFGAGDLRLALGLPGALPFDAGSFPLVETAVVAGNTLAVGLLMRHLAANTALAYLLVPSLLFIALIVRSLSAALLVAPAQAFAWLTPGAQTGLALGSLLLALSLFLPVGARLMLAALALMAATVLVNIAPANPYSAAALAVWQQGHFLNFNGLTRLLSVAWPFLVLPYLILSSRER